MHDIVEAAPPEAGVTPHVEVLDSRTASVGSLEVRRVLPQRTRRTVGAWCFLDQAAPADGVAAGPGIGAHPHIGLQTVTWLLSGEMLHRDSLGTEQVLRPGEMNLMTAGRGIVHCEERLGNSRVALAQLWVAQPASTRNGAPDFEHHADPPRIDLEGAVATVLVGTLGDAHSFARRDTDHFGADIELRSRATIPLRVDHEHAVVPLTGTVTAEGRHVAEGNLVYLAPGRHEIELDSRAGARILLLGGTPFPERVLMWWNYVARTREEITDAHAAWTSRTDRFTVPPSNLHPIDVGPPPWARI